MALTWTYEPSPRYDADKRRIIGGAPDGSLELAAADGADLPGDWWAVSDDTGAVVGYGWLDATWGGDAEVTLAVADDAQGGGVGSYILAQLENEAATRGLNYVYNTVRAGHPDHDAVHDWLAVRGYRGSDADEALRKRVVPSGTPEPAPRRSPPPLTDDDADVLARGREESGGYVDVEDHRY